MQRSVAKTLIQLRGRNLPPKGPPKILKSPCDVFINHRGIDTKQNVAGLLFDYFKVLGLRPFLDSRNMRPGDKLSVKITEAIGRCKVGIAVFSPNYCESPFCLEELALLKEMEKKVIPIFCNVKPSQLHVIDDGDCSEKDLKRLRTAIEDAKNTVGLSFDTSRGDWSELLKDASEAVITSMLEVDKEWACKNPHYFGPNTR